MKRSAMSHRRAAPARSWKADTLSAIASVLRGDEPAAAGPIVLAPRARRSDRVIDPYIVDAVHQLPCCARRLAGARCWGRIEADHAGPRPYGRRCHDTQVIPLCSQCHADRTNASKVSGGPFATMAPPERRGWCDAQIFDVQTWHYGRALVAADLDLVRSTVAEGRSTRALFLPHLLNAAL